MKLFFRTLLFLLFVTPAAAQFTTVTGTVTDTNSLAYDCGTITATIVNNNGQNLYLNGQLYTPAPSPVQLGCALKGQTSGAFLMSLGDNTQIKCGSGIAIVTCATQTQWTLTANTTGVLPPVGTGPQTCSATLTISGGNQVVTSSFVSCPLLTNATSTGTRGTVNPAVCSPGQIFSNTSTNPPVAYVCGNGNVWTVIGGGTATSPINAPNPFVFNTSMVFKGPAPNVDVQAFGARAVVMGTFATNFVVAATCASGSATLSGVGAGTGSFVNGDGVALYGCGASNTMSAPGAITLVPSIAATDWNTGIDVPQPAGGAVNVCYRISGNDANQGLTPAATEVCANTFALGSTSGTVTSASRSNAQITYTVSGFTPSSVLAAGARIGVNGTSDDANFGGYFTVASVGASTVVVNTGNDTRFGAPTSATGGTMLWAYDMHVNLPAISGTTQRYLIFSGATGAEVAYAFSKPFGISPQSASNSVYQDFGISNSKFTGFAPWVPTNPPTVAVADTLDTTIVSGANTATPTLAANAGQNFTTTMRLDAAPGWRAANAAAQFSSNGGGMVWFSPSINSNNEYPIQTQVTVANVSISQSQLVRLFDTVTMNQSEWYGDQTPNFSAKGQVSFTPPHTLLKCFGGYPCILNTGNFDSYEGITLLPSNPGNGQIDMFSMNSNQTYVNNVGFEDDGSGCNIVGFEQANTNSFGWSMNTVSLNSAFQPGFGQCSTPMLVSKFGSEMNLHYNVGSGRGYFFYNTANLTWDGGEEIQGGGGSPTFTFYNDVVSTGDWVRIYNIIQDTIGGPLLTFEGNLGNNIADNLLDGFLCCASNMALVSGLPVRRLAIGGTQTLNPQKVGANVNVVFDSGAANGLQAYEAKSIHMPGPSSSIGSGQILQSAAPVAALTTTGCGATHTLAGAHTYTAIFFDVFGTLFGVNNNAFHVTSGSPASNSVNPNGTTQCVNVTEPTVPTGAVFWYALRDGYASFNFNGTINVCTLLPVATTTFVDSDAAANGCTGNQLPLPNTSDLAALNNGTVYGQNVNSASYSTIVNCASPGGTCTSAAAGAVTIAAAATTVTIATTAVTANSQITVTEDSSLGARLSVTCNTTAGRTYSVTARTAGTSFVITANTAPITNPACLNFTIVN